VKEANGPTDPVVPSLLILLLLTLATQLGSLAYTTERDFSAVVLPSTIVLLLVTLPLAALGLRLGAPIGLGAPDIGAPSTWMNTSGCRRRSPAQIAAAGSSKPLTFEMCVNVTSRVLPRASETTRSTTSSMLCAVIGTEKRRTLNPSRFARTSQASALDG